MRSKLFQASQFSEEDRRYLGACVQAILAMEEDTWRRVCDAWPTVSMMRDRDERQRAIEDQIQELGIGRDAAAQVSDVADLIAQGQQTEYTRGQPDLVAEDLLDFAQGVPDRSRALQTLQRFVEHVSDVVAPLLETRKQERWYAAGVLSTLSAFDMTTEARAQLTERFRPIDDVERYEPRIVGLIPIVSIRLKTDDDKDFSFQCDRAVLRLLVTRLRAAEKEMDALEQQVGLL